MGQRGLRDLGARGYRGHRGGRGALWHQKTDLPELCHPFLSADRSPTRVSVLSPGVFITLLLGITPSMRILHSNMCEMHVPNGLLGA